WLSVNRAFFKQNLLSLNTAKQQKNPHPQCLNLGGDYSMSWVLVVLNSEISESRSSMRGKNGKKWVCRITEYFYTRFYILI
ncbi:MAG: hypothetical protein ACO3BJ_03145, partial [Burkholderiaceae bacterium]